MRIWPIKIGGLGILGGYQTNWGLVRRWASTFTDTCVWQTSVLYLDSSSWASIFRGFRDECLNLTWFLALDDAWKTIETWRIDYNKCRPHHLMNDRKPQDFVTEHQHPGFLWRKLTEYRKWPINSGFCRFLGLDFRAGARLDLTTRRNSGGYF